MNDEQQNLAFRFAHVALPAYATDCEPWEWHEDAWRRFFAIQEWNVGSICVSVAGEQTHHGNVTRWLQVGGEDKFTKSSRRHLMEALELAGQLLDSLAS
jgi:hypothetical protein